jgi:hypothetical protein
MLTFTSASLVDVGIARITSKHALAITGSTPSTVLFHRWRLTPNKACMETSVWINGVSIGAYAGIYIGSVVPPINWPLKRNEMHEWTIHGEDS